jgi:hypothetical protein
MDWGFGLFGDTSILQHGPGFSPGDLKLGNLNKSCAECWPITSIEGHGRFNELLNSVAALKKTVS